VRTQFGEQLRYQEVVAVGPGSLPVHRNDVKMHIRQATDVTWEDNLIDNQIREATVAVEQDSHRCLVMQTIQTYIDRFPLLSRNQAGLDLYPTNNIEIRRCPVFSVDSITYTDYNGAVQTWSLSTYAQYNTADEPCQIRYKWGGMWPIARLQEKSICITTHNGYLVPFTASANTLTLNGYTPVNGDKWRVSNSGGAIPSGLSLMTDYYVINASGQTCQLSTTAGGSAVSLSDAGSGYNFLGEIHPLAFQAILLRVGMEYVDREGAEYNRCRDGYWSKINGLRYEGP
jgi:hypothetical protein